MKEPNYIAIAQRAFKKAIREHIERDPNQPDVYVEITTSGSAYERCKNGIEYAIDMNKIAQKREPTQHELELRRKLVLKFLKII